VSVNTLGVLPKCPEISTEVSRQQDQYVSVPKCLESVHKCPGSGTELSWVRSVHMQTKVSLATGPYHMTGHRIHMSVQWGHAKMR